MLAGLEAAFVDIGLEKNGFLHVDEIVLPGVEAPRRGRGSGRDSRQITDMLKPGQEIVVQVVKDPLKTKGARLTMDLTIAGRYMVFAPYGEGVGVSRRLDDERARAAAQGGRQARSEGRRARSSAPRPRAPSAADFERELLYLFKLNEVLQKRVAETPAPALVFQEADLSVRVVRDIFSASSSGRSSTTPSSTTGWCRSSRAPRPSSSTRSSCGRRSSRCSRRSGSRRCSTRRCRAGSTSPAAAT